MIINNCTNCGRKPEMLLDEWHFYPKCKCGKTVNSNGNLWSESVASDMWNMANPVEDQIKSDYINYLADQAAKVGLKPVFSEFGEFRFIPTQYISVMHRDLMIEFTRHKIELCEFYKNRLKPGVNV
jgi:hypothetical protein